MTKSIFLITVLAGLVSAPTWGDSENESTGRTFAVAQASQFDALGALVLVMLANAQGMHGRSALRETRMDSGSSATSGAADETGLAAVYSSALAGHRTASGVRYEPKRLTAAHKLLPFGTLVRVTNLKNGKTVELTITDRGPRQPERILDLSRAAAHQLGIGAHGMARVRLTVLDADLEKTET